MADGNLEAVRSKLAKADEFFQMADAALELNAYDAAVSCAASAAINGTDALMLSKTGVLPSGSDHRQAVTALRRQSLNRAAQHLSNALAGKNRAQYEIRRSSQKEAEDAVRSAGRLLDAVKDAI